MAGGSDPQRLDPVFVALGDATRRSVMELLASGAGTTATQLAARFPVTRQAITKHLQVLGEAGLVVAARKGRETHWTLTPESLGSAMQWMADVGGAAGTDDGDAFGDRVAALQRHLGERRSDRATGEPRRRDEPAPGIRPPLKIAASSRVNRPKPPRS
jgi:DNA-binding transcriptional ArsR family regulator